MKAEISPEARLVRCMRLLMSGWARRWKVIRRDFKEADNARHCLQESIRCRDLARQWAA